MATQTQATDRRVTGGSPANVMKHLAGMSFPAQKNDIVRAAHENDAPQEVLDRVENLPEQEYGGPQEILKAFGENQ